MSARPGPARPTPAASRAYRAAPGAIAAPAPQRRRSRYPATLVADVVAAAGSGPGVTASAIHARLSAGWPQGHYPPPSRSTVERWVRRGLSARVHAVRGEPRLARRWSGGGRP